MLRKSRRERYMREQLRSAQDEHRRTYSDRLEEGSQYQESDDTIARRTDTRRKPSTLEPEFD